LRAVREEAQAQQEALTRQAIERLIPKELLPKIEEWGEANGCRREDAIARLVERGLGER
jgi:hypothetical protein